MLLQYFKEGDSLQCVLTSSASRKKNISHTLPHIEPYFQTSFPQKTSSHGVEASRDGELTSAISYPSCLNIHIEFQLNYFSSLAIDFCYVLLLGNQHL